MTMKASVRFVGEAGGIAVIAGLMVMIGVTLPVAGTDDTRCG